MTLSECSYENCISFSVRSFSREKKGFEESVSTRRYYKRIWSAGELLSVVLVYAGPGTQYLVNVWIWVETLKKGRPNGHPPLVRESPFGLPVFLS